MNSLAGPSGLATSFDPGHAAAPGIDLRSDTVTRPTAAMRAAIAAAEVGDDPYGEDPGTPGQPSAEELAALGSQGFGAVIYLAPPGVPDAVTDEARIVGRQGLVFVNLPVRFDAPTAADFAAFSALVQALQERRLLVHCQINLRASTLVFLHRAIVLREDPRAAWEAVGRVWTPEGPWRRLVEQQLAAHGIAFDPF